MDLTSILQKMIISFKVRFGTDVFKTDICKKSLNPQWNSEWFKFEVMSITVSRQAYILHVNQTLVMCYLAFSFVFAGRG